MTNYTTNNNNNKGKVNKSGHSPDFPPSVAPPERDSELAAIAEKIRAFFAPPPELALAAGIIERQTRRREACIALAEHLAEPDGTFNLINLNLGKIAKSLSLKYKHARQALRDLLHIGGFARQKILLFGNGCGHNPEAPRYFTPPEKHKLHPMIIRRTIEAACRYYVNPGILPALNAVNGSTRQQRSERREACVALLCCLLHYTELVTLRVGIPQADGSMKGLTVPYLAQLSGLDERRAERAFKDLKAAGIITVHTICEKLDELSYKGVAAIRTVSQHLFTALGFGDWLRNERRKAAERRQKKDAKRNAKAAANVNMAMNPQRGRRNAGEKPAADTARRGGMQSAGRMAIDVMRDILKNSKDPPD